MGSVDDPEKHLLGNLLEDDPLSSLGPSSTRTTTSAEAPAIDASIPPAPSSVFRPISSSYWPEPPPPYSPRIPSESWLGTGLGFPPQVQQPALQNDSLVNDNWLSSLDQKDANLNNNAEVLRFNSVGLNINHNISAASASAQIAALTSFAPPRPENQQEVHHFHHNLHHHTHTHNVQVRNHYFTTTTSSTSSALSLPINDALGDLNPLNLELEHPVNSGGEAWTYNGIKNVPETPKSLLFSDWKKDLNLKSVTEVPARGPNTSSPIDGCLPNSSVSSKQDKKKEKSRSYAKASSSSSSGPSPSPVLNQSLPQTNKKGGPATSEKKQKNELTKKLSGQATLSPTVSPTGMATRIEVKGQPHSAPVVTKMPFSYRDVAARVEPVHGAVSQHNASIPHEESPAQVVQLHHQSATETERKNEQNVLQNQEKQRDVNAASKERKDRKGRSDNEFQKINRNANKKEKNSKAVFALPTYEGVPRVDASSRYDVLNNLENVASANAQKKSGRVPVLQQVFSRSSSGGDDLESEAEEVQGTRSSSNHNSVGSSSANSRQHHLSRKEQQQQQQKKRLSVQSTQRRRTRRKSEPRWSENVMWIFDILIMIGSHIGSVFQWTAQLVVDFCLKIYDVCLYSIESFFHGMIQSVRKCAIFVFVFVLFLLESLWCVFRSVTLTRIVEQMLYEDRPEITEWGCRRDLALPNTANEYVERLIRENHHDAFVVFGLRNDCSDDDIKRNYKRLCALVSPDKCNLDGAEEAFDLLNRAYEAIGNPISRLQYSIENAYTNEDHRCVIASWDELRERIEDSRCTIYCDCGSRHLRFMTNIRPSEARYCKRCDMNHPAKQNDIWVEKRFLGLKSVYLTCTDNVVYDISQWAMCEGQRNMLRNMRAHTHNVQYRLVTPTANPEAGESISNYVNGANATSSGVNLSALTHDHRYFNEFTHEDFNLLRQQRSLAQISFKTCEPREEDRSRRAANRRQKRWR